MLATLRTSRAVLSIGLGHPTASVALYLDSDSEPWHAEGTPLPNPPAFRDRQTSRHYETYLSPDDVRRIASEFIANPDVRPASAEWRREGSAHS